MDVGPTRCLLPRHQKLASKVKMIMFKAALLGIGIDTEPTRCPRRWRFVLPCMGAAFGAKK